jgi:hypothetical protein
MEEKVREEKKLYNVNNLEIFFENFSDNTDNYEKGCRFNELLSFCYKEPEATFNLIIEQYKKYENLNISYLIKFVKNHPDFFYLNIKNVFNIVGTKLFDIIIELDYDAKNIKYVFTNEELKRYNKFKYKFRIFISMILSNIFVSIPGFKTLENGKIYHSLDTFHLSDYKFNLTEEKKQEIINYLPSEKKTKNKRFEHRKSFPKFISLFLFKDDKYKNIQKLLNLFISNDSTMIVINYCYNLDNMTSHKKRLEYYRKTIKFIKN